MTQMTRWQICDVIMCKSAKNTDGVTVQNTDGVTVQNTDGVTVQNTDCVTVQMEH
jgi:hypothetical protein